MEQAEEILSSDLRAAVVKNLRWDRETGLPSHRKPPSEQQIAEAILQTVPPQHSAALSEDALERATLAVAGELSGAGPLHWLLTLPRVTDVLVNGPREVWVDRGTGLEQTAVDLGDEQAVRDLAVRMAQACGVRLDDALPYADGQLPDGTRFHAILAPHSGHCTAISLRVPAADHRQLGELLSSGMVPQKASRVLLQLVSRRTNYLITGATGSGKTTLLGALLGQVPPDERILCIEQAAELRPNHPHFVRLLAREANVEGAGGVSMELLVRQAMRMRPDRLVLGECRGSEVREVLAALNTGHQGGCATLHANSAADVPARLEALGALAGMSREALAAQAAAGLDAIIHLRRHANGQRQVSEIAVLARDEQGTLRAENAISFDDDGSPKLGAAWPAFHRRLAGRSP